MTLRDPIIVPPTSERYVMVGDSRCAVSEQEWIAASLNAGDRVRITPSTKSSPTSPAAGVPYEAVVIGSGFYDGVHLYVEETRYIFGQGRLTVFPDFGDVIEPLEREVQRA